MMWEKRETENGDEVRKVKGKRETYWKKRDTKMVERKGKRSFRKMRDMLKKGDEMKGNKKRGQKERKREMK